MSNDKLKETEKKPEHKPDDNLGLNVSGHILIRDKDTGQELVNKRNAIHYGNMAYIVAQALTNSDDAFIHYMAFGNGATSVDTAGTIKAAIAQQESMDRQDELMQYKSESLTGKIMIAIESDDEEGIAEVEKDYRGNVPLASRVKLGLTPEHLEYMEERKERLLVERQAKAKAKHERNVEAASKFAEKNSEV